MRRYKNIDVIKNILNEDIIAELEGSDVDYTELLAGDDFAADAPDDVGAEL